LTITSLTYERALLIIEYAGVPYLLLDNYVTHLCLCPLSLNRMHSFTNPNIVAFFVTSSPLKGPSGDPCRASVNVNVSVFRRQPYGLVLDVRFLSFPSFPTDNYVDTSRMCDGPGTTFITTTGKIGIQIVLLFDEVCAVLAAIGRAAKFGS
jgi:hypothetical protein